MNEHPPRKNVLSPLPSAAQQLTDILMKQRMIAIKPIERSIRQLLALRRSVATDEVDDLLFGFRTVLRFLVSIRPESVPTQDEAIACLTAVRELQDRLAKLATGETRLSQATADIGAEGVTDASRTVSNLMRI